MPGPVALGMLGAVEAGMAAVEGIVDRPLVAAQTYSKIIFRKI